MKCSSRLPLSLLIAFSTVVLGAAETTESKPSAPLDPWPLENVEIKPSPKVTWGQLENGLRYAIMPHASPPDHVSMRLLVTAGSLDENDDERGYAHFVEHMAFNGTKHFPAGELVKFLQRQGAVFGPDINAFTTHTHTLYKLELPDNSAATVETGLRIFRDFADGLLFETGEIKRESGVILSEERSTHTPGMATQLALTDFLYQGTRIPARQPIGLIPLIEHADAPALKKFYNAWYRPENMCVVIVGEVDALQVETQVRTQFASLAAHGPARVMPAVGKIEPAAELVVTTQIRQQNGFHISLIKVTPRASTLDTWGTQLEGLRLESAFAILAGRLDRLTQVPDRTLSGSSTSTDVEYGRFRKMTVAVASSIDEWEKAMAIVEQEVRRVIEHGFSPEELAYQQTALRELFRTLAQSLPTMQSSDLAEAIAESLEERTPFALKGETLDQALAMTERLNAGDCQRAFREYWGEQAPHILIETAADYIPPVEKIRSVYHASRNMSVATAASVAATVFAYEDFGPAGEVVEKTHVADLDLWLVRFANGVRLNLKRTAFENGLARINVRIGHGNLSEPEDKPGLHFWAGAWWFGGVGKHTAGELARIVDGLESVSGNADDDAFVLNGSARAEHFPRALRELTALVSDPAFRPEGHQEMSASLHSTIDPLWNSADGAVQLQVLPSLTDRNPRIGFPNVEATFTRTSDELQAWMAPQLASGAIEVTVVGDIEPGVVIAEMAKTFGTLPARQPKPGFETERKVTFPQKSVSTFSYYHGPADRPSTLEFFWPVRDPLAAADRRRLPMLATIIAGRVTDQVREKKGATYSPNAYFVSNSTYPGFAFIRCTLEVKPQDAVLYGDTVRDLAAKLAQTGVTSDELARAKAQYSAAMQGWKTDNNFWLTILSAAQERPQDLADIRSAANDIAQTSVADLNTLARKYLGSDRVFRYIIEPDARMPKPK